jgi:hypothetical protein
MSHGTPAGVSWRGHTRNRPRASRAGHHGGPAVPPGCRQVLATAVLTPFPDIGYYSTPGTRIFWDTQWLTSGIPAIPGHGKLIGVMISKESGNLLAGQDRTHPPRPGKLPLGLDRQMIGSPFNFCKIGAMGPSPASEPIPTIH